MGVLIRMTHASGRPAAALALMASLWVAGPAAAQTPSSPRVLVLPFSAQAEAQAPGGAGAALWLREAAALLLSEGLDQLGVGTFSRNERVVVFDRLRLPLSGSFSRATTIRVGELVGASEVVFGELRLGSKLSVRVRAIDLQTSRQLPDIADEAALSDLFPLFERLSDRLAHTLGRRVTAPRRPPAISLEAFENYVKGLVAATPAAQQRFLETAMMRAPRDGRILNGLWSVYTEQGAHDKALAAVSAVPPDSPYLTRARFNLALSLIELRRFDGAFRELTALYGQRRAAAVSNALGVVQLRRGITTEPVSATRYFERAVSEDPAGTDYLFNVGYARAVVNDAAGALHWLRETVRRDAADGDAHLVMSAMLSATGRTVEAQRELELARQLGTSLETPPASVSSKVPPGLERIETEIDAAAHIDAVITNPAQRDQQDMAAFHLQQARRLMSAQKDREAMSELRRAIYLSPYEDEPHLLVGKLHQRAGRLADAIDEFKVAIWCRESAAARVALGAALLESGDKDAARREAERAIVLAPSLEEARELLKKTGGL